MLYLAYKKWVLPTLCSPLPQTVLLLLLRHSCVRVYYEILGRERGEHTQVSRRAHVRMHTHTCMLFVWGLNLLHGVGMSLISGDRPQQESKGKVCLVFPHRQRKAQLLKASKAECGLEGVVRKQVQLTCDPCSVHE